MTDFNISSDPQFTVCKYACRCIWNCEYS